MRHNCIVTGKGEEEAVPTLLRRIAALNNFGELEIPLVVRVPEGKLVKTGELERAVDLVARKSPPETRILVVLDGEDACPAELGPRLQARARDARPDRDTRVVVAYREFESWFLHAAVSLGGRRGLPVNLSRPSDPDSIRGAKEWLTAHMPQGRAYSPTLDQAALAAVMDLDQAKMSNSFDKFLREAIALFA